MNKISRMALKICIVFLLIIIYISYNIYPLAIAGVSDDPIKSAVINVNMGRKKRDCFSETIFCASRADCVDSCIDLNYTCDMRSKTCQPLIFETETTGSSVDVECDSRKGSYWAMGVDEITGEGYHCIRRFPNLFDEKGVKHKHVCNGGTFDVNVNVKLPSLSDCKCTRPWVLAYHEGSPDVPRCVDPQLLNYITTMTRV